MAHEPDASEILDPGPEAWGGVRFVHVRHPETGGTGTVPEHLVLHHEHRGWETYDPLSPPEVAEIAEGVSLSMKRSDLDDTAALAGVPEPETLPSKQAVIAAIAALAPTDPPSSPDDTTS